MSISDIIQGIILRIIAEKYKRIAGKNNR